MNEVTVWAIYTNQGVYTRHLFASTQDIFTDEGCEALAAEFVQICSQIGIDPKQHNYCTATAKQAAEAVLV